MSKHSHLLRLILVFGLMIMTAQAQTNASNASKLLAPDLFRIKVPIKFSPQMIPVCYNFGCKIRDLISLSSEEWASVEAIFKPQTSSPSIERIRIGKAIARMEQLAGKHTPIYRDIGYNLGKGAVFPGQLDCIDESINTTTFLHVLERGGLFKHHKVIKRAYRRAIFDQHWTGQVQELKTTQRFVIDTWFYDNGEMPIVQPTEKWLDISIFTSYTNNSEKPEQSDNSEAFTQKTDTKTRSLVN